MNISDLSNGDTSKLPSYSNPELLLLVGLMRTELHPDFVMAAIEELAKRNISQEDLEQAKKMENYEIRRASAIEKNQEERKHNGGLGILLITIGFLLFFTIYLALFGLILYAAGIYYVINSDYTTAWKIIWIAGPVIGTTIFISII